MVRLNLLVLLKDERVVLRVLAESGAVQLARAPAGPEMHRHDRAGQVAECKRLVCQVEELRKALGIAPATPTRPQTAIVGLEELEDQVSVLKERATALLKRRQELQDRYAKLSGDCEQLSKYAGLEIPLAGPDRFTFLHFITGTLPAGNLEILQREIGPDAALLPLPEHQGRQDLLAITTRQGKTRLEQLLGNADFHAEALPNAQGATTDSLFQERQRERENRSAELRSLGAELKALAGQAAGQLAELHAAAETEWRLLEAEQSFPCTGSAILLSGWVPQKSLEELQQQVLKVTQKHCAFEIWGPEKIAGEEAPTLLGHPRWLRPFDLLVSAYGLPNYRELEPTLFVAITFLLMFGMMFGDVGHGAVLATAGLSVLRFGVKRTFRETGLLLLFSGLSSLLFGSVYGSCFGIPAFKKYALWHDPLEGDPMSLMSASIGIGVCVISLGLLCNIYNRFRRGDVIGAVLDKFGVVGALFYWGMLVLVGDFQAIQARGLAGPAILLVVALPIVGWALKEPLEYFLHRRPGEDAGGGLFSASTESLVGAFEAILSYLANTISFVRLAAYAMSHAALLAAAFIMAAAVEHSATAGGFLSVIVIIFGNLVAIVLEGTIASVQALRLEYYEFFGKFFSGTGRAFEPFRLTFTAAAT